MEGTCWLPFAPEWIARRRPELLILRGVSDRRRSFLRACLRLIVCHREQVAAVRVHAPLYLLLSRNDQGRSFCRCSPLPRSPSKFVRASSQRYLRDKQVDIMPCRIQASRTEPLCVCVCHQARLKSVNHRRPTLRILSRCDHWNSETILIHVRDLWRAFARRSGFAAWSAGGKLDRRRSSRV